MPVVDDVVVLDAWVGAFPRGHSDFVKQLARVYFFDNFASGAGAKTELAAVFNRGHELGVYAHRVVGVLILNGVNVFSAKFHVEACVAKNTNLLLFAGFGLDELFDVWVVNIKNNHLGRAAGCATRLDGSCRGISAAHEGNRTRCRATAVLEQFFRGSNT